MGYLIFEKEKRMTGKKVLLGLLAFEFVNIFATYHGLVDLFGSFLGIGLVVGTARFVVPWVAILAFGYAGIDYVGLSRIFTIKKVWEESYRYWCLVGAWIVAAVINTVLVYSAFTVFTIGTFSFAPLALPIAVLMFVVRCLLIGS
ncbi:MAG: hypothetical protein UW80_C0025G0014, partial [Microgenomates group bacterium GW2011_GWC1_44_9]